MSVTLQSKLGVSDAEMDIVRSIFNRESLDESKSKEKSKHKKVSDKDDKDDVVETKKEVSDIVGEEFIPKSPVGVAFNVLKFLAKTAKDKATAAASSAAPKVTPSKPPTPSVAKDATPDVPKISPPGTPPPGKSLTRKMDSASAAANDSNLPDVSPTTPKSNVPAVQGNRAVDPYVNKGEVLPPRSVVRSPQTNKPGIDIDGSVFKEPPKIAGSIVKKAAIPSILAAPLLLSKDTAKASDPITPADKPTMPDGSATNSRMPADKPTMPDGSATNSRPASWSDKVDSRRNVPVAAPSVAAPSVAAPSVAAKPTPTKPASRPIVNPVANKPAAKPELSADDLNSISLDLVKGNTPAVAEPLKKEKEKESAVDRIKNRMKEISPTVNEEEEIDFDALSEAEGNATHTGKIASSLRIVKALQKASENDVEVPFNFENNTTMDISPALAKLALRYYNGLSAFEKAQAAKMMRSSFKQFLDVARRK